MRFWLGVHHPDWLERTDVPLMLQHRSLQHRKTPPRARGPWILDSGGFTELAAGAHYATSSRDYVANVRRFADQIGNMEYAAIQDWMCEAPMLERTGLRVVDHQRLTIESFLDLRELAPDLPWLPVLQGQTLSDYLHHVDAYTSYGINLWSLPLIGLGSVCRRQGTVDASRLVLDLARLKLPLHGFGFKTTSLIRCGESIASGDSMSWSFDGRYPHGGRCSAERDHEEC